MTSRYDGRNLELEALKALAHPLRVRIFDALSIYGPATSSGLAERLGESSGATSYHLRQLEKHNFIREVLGRGVGRERWWERVPGSINVDPDTADGSEAARQASQVLVNEWQLGKTRELEKFLQHGKDELSKEWIDASVISTISVWATAVELSELTDRIMELLGEFSELHRDQRTPGSRPLQIHFNSFPVIDGEEISQEPS